MSNGDGLTITLSDGEGDGVSWEVGLMTNGPEGRYLLIDRDGDPRLILTGEELAEFQRSIAGGGRP